MSLQAPLAETDHKNAKPQNEGAAVSRRMASSIRSGPEGARGVFRSKVTFPIFYFLLMFFLQVDYLRRIFEIGVFLGGGGVITVTPRFRFFALLLHQIS